MSFVHLSLPENQPTFGYQGNVYVLTVSKIGELDVKRMTKIGLPQLDKWHITVNSQHILWGSNTLDRTAKSD